VLSLRDGDSLRSPQTLRDLRVVVALIGLMPAFVPTTTPRSAGVFA
jgi:hypothetical protein